VLQHLVIQVVGERSRACVVWHDVCIGKVRKGYTGNGVGDALQGCDSRTS